MSEDKEVNVNTNERATRVISSTYVILVIYNLKVIFMIHIDSNS